VGNAPEVPFAGVVDAPRQAKKIVAEGQLSAPDLGKPTRPNPPDQAVRPDFDALRLAAQIRRTELGLTLKQTAARADASESAITGTLYGYHDGSVRTWFAIAHALEMSIGDLMGALESHAPPMTPAPDRQQAA